MKSFVITVLLAISAMSVSADPVGTVSRVETTPVDLSDLGMTFERLAFTFPEPVQGRFWIEYQSGDEAPKKHPVPSDAVPPSTSFALAYVHTSEHSAFVSVTTTHDGRSDRRTGSYGTGNEGGTRVVTYAPTSDKVSINTDFELFTAEIKPNWRRSKDPTLRFRIMARFTATK